MIEAGIILWAVSLFVSWHARGWYDRRTRPDLPIIVADVSLTERLGKRWSESLSHLQDGDS